MPIRRLLASTMVLAISALATGPAAVAAPVTIGQLPESVPIAGCANGPRDVFQLTLSGGSEYVVPPGYTEIASWSTYAAEGAGQLLGLKVFDDHLPSDEYAVIKHDPLRPLTPGVINTFPVEIPVAGGDVIGLDNGNSSLALPNACAFSASPTDAFAFSLNLSLGDGQEGTYKVEKGDRINVSAVVEAPPAANFVSPARGPVSGGTSVIIAGHDLTGAKAVAFGDAPATRFTVDSDDAITAVSPPSSSATGVEVTVTTAAGTTAKSPDVRFTYEPLPPAAAEQVPQKAPSCVVPRLRGRRLAAARRRLRAAHCSAGRVRGRRGPRARVKGQSAKPGTVLPAGTAVNVRLGLS
jgi:hypothetical protein